ncbi:MotA/TolQ/ExbB proton channel family protein [Candidatus Sumerlaeota bacterium]
MLKHILDGGPIMIPLLMLSVMAIAIIIDRLRVFRIAQADTAPLREAVIRQLEGGQIEEAIRECETRKGPVAAVLMVGLVKFRKLLARGKSMTEIEANVNKTMTDYAPHVIESLEKRLNLLAMIGAVSPLLGMTGTVTGMIASFESMSSGLDAARVSTGISEALVTTAAGLIIAIPAVVAYSIFAKKVDRFILEIEESATDLIDFITLEHEIMEP